MNLILYKQFLLRLCNARSTGAAVRWNPDNRFSATWHLLSRSPSTSFRRRSKWFCREAPWTIVVFLGSLIMSIDQERHLYLATRNVCVSFNYILFLCKLWIAGNTHIVFAVFIKILFNKHRANRHTHVRIDLGYAIFPSRRRLLSTEKNVVKFLLYLLETIVQIIYSVPHESP